MSPKWERSSADLRIPRRSLQGLRWNITAYGRDSSREQVDTLHSLPPHPTQHAKMDSAGCWLSSSVRHRSERSALTAVRKGKPEYQAIPKPLALSSGQRTVLRLHDEHYTARRSQRLCASASSSAAIVSGKSTARRLLDRTMELEVSWLHLQRPFQQLPLAALKALLSGKREELLAAGREVRCGTDVIVLREGHIAPVDSVQGAQPAWSGIDHNVVHTSLNQFPKAARWPLRTL